MFPLAKDSLCLSSIWSSSYPKCRTKLFCIGSRGTHTVTGASPAKYVISALLSMLETALDCSVSSYKRWILA